MAPSRGWTTFMWTRARFRLPARRCYSNFAQLVADTSRKSQVYISRTTDPFVNLSVEHFLLQKSPPESTILFLYTNRPCIVIGRNQNPWVEVNLGLLNESAELEDEVETRKVELLRRRSGGGTVFHDEGNVNYSVICPTALFNRDKHAQMVVRALRGLGVENTKVNERHDIVLDIESAEAGNSLSRGKEKPLKVSGSAYKLTRLRALHHGTCLLSSPNLKIISEYLRSPAKPYIKARGVDSVSSPIANVEVDNEAFEEAVVDEFGKMYGFDEPIVVTGEEIQIPEIARGHAELRSLEWTYLQTPQFTFSTHKTDDDSRDRPPLPDSIPPDVSISFTARNGVIISAEFDFGVADSLSQTTTEKELESKFLAHKKLHLIEDWQNMFPHLMNERSFAIPRWLNELLGNKSQKFD